MLWLNIKSMIEVAYYLSGIALIFGLYWAYKQFKHGVEHIELLKKDMLNRSKRDAVNSSLDMLHMYAVRILPMMQDYKEKFQSEVPDPEVALNAFNDDLTLRKPLDQLGKVIVAELIVKQKSGLYQLLNELELFSVAIIERIVDEEVMFAPVALTFCEFIESEKLALSASRSRGVPFKNLVELCLKWESRLEIERLQMEAQYLELQKREKEHRIKIQGDFHKSQPPLGQDI